MKKIYLDFEKKIEELEDKIEGLRFQEESSAVDISDEIYILGKKAEKLIRDVYSNLNAWEVTQVARHPQRPFTGDYIKAIFSDFKELKGDRQFSDDSAIVGGLARLDDISVMIVGHQKGRDTKDKIYRNFGMPKPEGYRKALRLMKLAEKFGIPVVTFIDTPGAYPGVGAEQRGQSEAIAKNLYAMAELDVPILVTVIGEGGSGGALALGVGDLVLMLQYAIYSVISPEGCASILWKDAGKASVAAESLGITADRLSKLNLIDQVVTEPVGGAHRDPEAIFSNLRTSIKSGLKLLTSQPINKLQELRMQKLDRYGSFRE